jgi:hypothetical protein
MKRVMCFALLILAALGSITPALAQEGGYDLDWWTVDGGGVSSPPSTGYSLGGTVGQPDAATWQGENGYTLSGGFWTGGAAAAHEIYLPIVLRQFP